MPQGVQVLNSRITQIADVVSSPNDIKLHSVTSSTSAMALASHHSVLCHIYPIGCPVSHAHVHGS